MQDPSELVQTSAMTFAWKGSNMPMVCFTKNDEGKNVMLIGGSYYEQTSNFWAMLKRAVIIIAFLFILSSVIIGLFSLITGIIGKHTWQKIIPSIIPMIGVGSLAWAIYYLLEVQQYTYKLSELDTVNLQTLIIFFGTCVFGIVSIVSLLYSIKTFQKHNRRWYAIYLLLTSISLCLITAILWQNGWIGLRTWAL